MESKKKVIDPAPIIEKLAARCLETRGLECSVLGNVIDMLRAAPSANAVEVVHGRWAALDDDCEELEGEEEAMRWGCTACREIVEYADWTRRSRLTRYCPNCGAKMDGDGNE